MVWLSARGRIIEELLFFVSRPFSSSSYIPCVGRTLTLIHIAKLPPLFRYYVIWIFFSVRFLDFSGFDKRWVDLWATCMTYLMHVCACPLYVHTIHGIVWYPDGISASVALTRVTWPTMQCQAAVAADCSLPEAVSPQPQSAQFVLSVLPRPPSFVIRLCTSCERGGGLIGSYKELLGEPWRTFMSTLRSALRWTRLVVTSGMRFLR